MAKPAKLAAGQVVVTIGKAFHVDQPVPGKKDSSTQLHFAAGDTPTVDVETAALWKRQGLLAPDASEAPAAPTSGGK